jgi:hypothetical protein
MSRVFGPLFWVALTASCVGQVESGTIIVVAESRAKVVIAADSRSIDGDWKPHDDAEKIIVLSPTLVFAACGVVMDNSRTLAPNARFVASEVARKIARDFKTDPIGDQTVGTRTAQIALAWTLEMSARMRQGIAKQLNVWLFGRPASPLQPFIQGTFAGIEPDGSLSVATGIVDYIPDSPGLISPLARPYIELGSASDKLTWIEPRGMSQIAYSYIHGTSDFSIAIRKGMMRVDDFDERIPYELVQRTIDEAQELGPGKPKGVGGKIDVVELTKGGRIEWLCKKSSCQFPGAHASGTTEPAKVQAK